MKQRSAYWWLFVTGGSLVAVGGAGIITGMILYPHSNLLGGFALVFGPIAFLGSSVFQITLVVWLIHNIAKWAAKRKRLTEKHTEKRPDQASATAQPGPGEDSSAH